MLGNKNNKGDLARKEKQGSKWAMLVEDRHRRWAAWMAARIGRLSAAKQKWLFAWFLILALGYCIMRLMGSGSGGLPDAGIISGVKLLPDTPIEKLSVDNELLRLASLKAYLDSLGQSSEGSKQLDSILMANPGILDSLIIWENRLLEMK